MTRRLISLLLALGALAACNDKPPGQLEPIPRPSDYKEPSKGDAAKAATAASTDPNKVTLRWNLAKGAPVAYRLDGTPAAATFYVLQRPDRGDLTLRLATQGPKATQDQGTFSERGFILDGLGAADRNVATLVLELPKQSVGVGDSWSLGTTLVDTESLGRNFVQKKAERHNTVKLASLTPEGDDRVATLEYDLLESVSGLLPPGSQQSAEEPAETSPLKPAKGKDKGKGKGKEHEHEQAAPSGDRNITTEVTFTGRGEFLVKAGRWRSWEGTLVSKTEGFTPAPDKNPTQVPPGALKLKLTALESVPAELQQPEAKK